MCSSDLAAGGSAEKSKEQKDYFRVMNKRQKGIERATKKLAKEDAEQVNELSKSKMLSYISKAAKTKKPSEKRMQGISTASRKVFNESFNLLSEETTPALVASMKAILADAFHMYFKAHSFHWNVEGADFPQYHKFLGDVYEQLFDTIDPIAEEIRALGEYAPRSLDELASATSISTDAVQTPAEMFSALLADNNKVLAGLNAGYKIAEASGEVGLANFLQDKIDAHKKLGWMIKSTSRGA